MNNELMFSSNKDNWSTPQAFFDTLNEEFHFTLDPCSDDVNHKCDKYFTKTDNGLLQDWGGKLFSATHPMVEIFINGWRNVIGKDTKKRRLLLC